MKFFFSILILPIITYTNEQASALKAIIVIAATKTSLATTEEINVKITNTGDATAEAGAVSGLSLVAVSVSKTVELNCAATQDTLAITNGTATVVCKPGSTESTAGVYVLTASESATVGLLLLQLIQRILKQLQLVHLLILLLLLQLIIIQKLEIIKKFLLFFSKFI